MRQLFALGGYWHLLPVRIRCYASWASRMQLPPTGFHRRSLFVCFWFAPSCLSFRFRFRLVAELLPCATMHTAPNEFGILRYFVGVSLHLRFGISLSLFLLLVQSVKERRRTFPSSDFVRSLWRGSPRLGELNPPSDEHGITHLDEYNPEGKAE